MSNLAQRLLHSWAEHSDRIALVQGDRTYTFADLLRDSAVVANVIEDSRALAVGVVDRGDIATRVYYYSAIRSGVTVVPLAPDWPLERMGSVLTEAKVSLVLDANSVMTRLDWTRRLERTLDGTVFYREPAVGDQHDRGAGQQDPVYILFTSGSSGRPKGVPVSGPAIESFCDAVIDRFNFTKEDRFSSVFRLTFDASVLDLMVPALVGAACVIPASRSALMTVNRYIVDSRLTVWFSVPTMIDVAERLDLLAVGSLPNLRVSMFIGEQFSFRQASIWATAATSSEIHNLYGPTEATVACSGFRLPDRLDDAHGPVPIGAAFPGTDFTVGSQRHVRELMLAGRQVMKGYVCAEDDREVYEIRGEQTWYRTGDLVSRREGHLYFESRIDRQVKVSGYRIELGEVETAFLRAGASRAHATVLGGSSGEKILVYVPSPEATTELIERARRALPQYMWPSTVDQLESFPLSPNGKVDQAALNALAQRAEVGGQSAVAE